MTVVWTFINFDSDFKAVSLLLCACVWQKRISKFDSSVSESVLSVCQSVTRQQDICLSVRQAASVFDSLSVCALHHLTTMGQTRYAVVVSYLAQDCCVADSNVSSSRLLWTATYPAQDYCGADGNESSYQAVRYQWSARH